MLPPKLNSDCKGNKGEEALNQNKDGGVDFGKKPHLGEEKASVVKETKRLEDLDIFKGLLIFFVVLGHLLLPVKDSPYPIFEKAFFLIYSFHMPAFVFLSGYLIYAGWSKKGVRFRSLLSYILLYLFMKLLLHPCDVFFYGEKRLLPDFLHESYTPWYILALLLWELLLLPIELFLIGRKQLKKSTAKAQNKERQGQIPNLIETEEEKRISFFYFLFLILLSIPLSFSTWGLKITDFLAADRFLSFVPFFFLGMAARNLEFSFQKIHILPAIAGGIFAVLLLFHLSALYPYTMVFYGTWGYRIEGEAISTFFKEYPILIRIGFIPYALCIAYFFYTILALIFRKNRGGIIKIAGSFLMKMGVYTLPIYVFHRPFRDAFFAFGGGDIFLRGEAAPLLAYLYFIFLIAFSLFTLWLLGRRSLDNLCRFRRKN